MRVKVEDTGQLRVLMRVKVKDTGQLRSEGKRYRSTYFVF